MLKRVMFWAALAFGICSVVKPSAHAAGQITLYAIPSPGLVVWQSPKSLAWSVILNALHPQGFTNNHDIGHVAVEVRCDGGTDRILAAMTDADDSEERELLFGKQAGLGLLFHTFAGRLQTPEEIERDLAERIPRGRVAWIRFKVNDGACARAVEYFDEYRARGLDRYYGLHLRPLYGEGAGCSAFGVSFLAVAGILDQELTDAWSYVRNVPESLIGDDSSGHRVSILTLLFSGQADHWARKGEPVRQIFFWDPDTMFAWIRRTWNSEHQTPTGRFLLQQEKKAKGLVVDRTAWAVPQGPIWRR